MTVSPVDRRLDADDRRDARRGLIGRAVAPAPVIASEAALGAGLGAHRVQLFGGVVGVIGLAGSDQRLGRLAVAVGAGELVHGLAVPGQPQPGEPVEDRGNRRVGGALAVGVLDPEQHPAAGVAGIEPVEERRARPADMEEAGG